MPDVLLVVMPYFAVERPAIGPSLLQARLAEEGICCEVCYANIRFAGEIGSRMNFILSNNHTTQLGEWTFGEAAFPDFQPDHHAYFEAMRFSLSPEKLLSLRPKAVAFVDRLAGEIIAKRPKIVGCSSMFLQNCASLALLRRIKERAPEIVTVMGGSNCEGQLGLGLIRLFPYLDFVVSGEADHSFPELCVRLLEPGFPGPDRLAPLPDGVYGPQDRSARQPDLRRAVVQHLDALPLPDYSDYFRELSASVIRDDIIPGLTVETSRGCWWGQKHQCTFCGLNGEGISYRRKSTGRIIDELRELGTRHSLWGFEAVDNIIDAKLTSELKPRLAELPQAPVFMFEIKANLTREQVGLLRETGVLWIQPGIESLSDRSLALINKGVQAWQNIALLKWAEEFGIHVIWNYLCRIPGDDDADYGEVAQWLPWIMHLHPQSGPAGLTPVMIDRFCDYYRNSARHGLTLRPLSLYSFIYPFSAQQLEEVAYLFEIAETAREPANGPGVANLLEQLSSWHLQYSMAQLPGAAASSTVPANSLLMYAMPDGVRVTDTRACAVVAEQRWHGVDAAVLAACDSALTLPEIRCNVETRCGRPVTEEEILQSVERLKSMRILLPISGRYLALPVNTPVRPKRDKNDIPGGRVLLHRQRPVDPKGRSILAVLGVEHDSSAEGGKAVATGR